MRNDAEMTKRLQTEEGFDARKAEKEEMEDLLQNENHGDNTIKDRFTDYKAS